MIKAWTKVRTDSWQIYKKQQMDTAHCLLGLGNVWTAVELLNYN